MWTDIFRSRISLKGALQSACFTRVRDWIMRLCGCMYNIHMCSVWESKSECTSIRFYRYAGTLDYVCSVNKTYRELTFRSFTCRRLAERVRAVKDLSVFYSVDIDNNSNNGFLDLKWEIARLRHVIVSWNFRVLLSTFHCDFNNFILRQCFGLWWCMRQSMHQCNNRL